MTVTLPELDTANVGEAMTPGVLTCLPVTPLRDVARMMARHRVHAIVVFGREDRLRPWGVVSDLDLVAAATTTHANAGAVAASPVVTVTPETPLLQAARLMEEHQTHHLLVISDKGLPVGILSTLDVARALAAEGDPGEI